MALSCVPIYFRTALSCSDVCVCNYHTDLSILRLNVRLCTTLVQRYHLLSALAGHKFHKGLNATIIYDFSTWVNTK